MLVVIVRRLKHHRTIINKQENLPGVYILCIVHRTQASVDGHFLFALVGAR